MKKPIQFPIILFLICFSFLSACRKEKINPKNDLDDLAYLIKDYLSKGDNFKVYLYKFPVSDTSAYILRTTSDQVLVEDYKLKIKVPSRTFDLELYNSMAVKYFPRKPADTARVERMDIYLDIK